MMMSFQRTNYKLEQLIVETNRTCICFEYFTRVVVLIPPMCALPLVRSLTCDLPGFLGLWGCPWPWRINTSLSKRKGKRGLACVVAEELCWSFTQYMSKNCKFQLTCYKTMIFKAK